MAAADPPDSRRLALELAAQVSSLQRALRRRTRAAVGEPGLSQAEGELLLLIASHSQLRVGDAATALRLAPNTVSTLARRLSADGLLLAERDDSDRRGVRLHASAAGTRFLRHWRDERAQVLARVLELLSDRQRRALASSLPVLAALAEALEDDGSAATLDAAKTRS